VGRVFRLEQDRFRNGTKGRVGHDLAFVVPAELGGSESPSQSLYDDPKYMS
jgi:hypothetical protein